MRPAILVHADARDLDLLRRLTFDLGWTLVIFSDEAGRFLVRAGVPFEWTGECMSLRRDVLAADLDALDAKCDQALRSPDYPAYLGLTGQEMDRFRQFIQPKLRQVFEWSIASIHTVRAVAQHYDLRLVILKHDHSQHTKAVTREAQANGVPVLFVEHGLPGYASKIQRTINADKVAAYGPFSQHCYLTAGTPPEKIAVTGNPAWDRYCRARDGDESDMWQMMEYQCGIGSREALRARLGLDGSRPLIMYASTWYSATHTRESTNSRDGGLRLFREIARAVKDVSQRHEVQFVVKVHPHEIAHEEAKTFPLIARQEGLTDLKLFFDRPADGLLLLSDVVVHNESSLAVEAMLLEKLLVNHRGDVLDRNVEGCFLDDDAMLHTYDVPQLAQAIEAALFSPDVRRALDLLRPDSVYRYGYVPDGRATDRVLALIEEMVGVPPTEDTPEQRGANGHAGDRHSYLAAAEKWFQRGQLEWAVAAATQAREGGEDRALAHYYIGATRLKQGAYAEAVESLAQAVAEAPHVADFRNALGGALLARGDLNAAGDEFQQAIRLDGRNVLALLNMADLQRRRGDLQGAERSLLQAFDAAPEQADVLLGLADVYRQRGELEQAKTLYGRVLELYPANERAWEGLLGNPAMQTSESAASQSHE